VPDSAFQTSDAFYSGAERNCYPIEVLMQSSFDSRAPVPA
jgi:hypothetical protein